jgi:4-amino-4-deoxy-L-arabinose transferase-like glycosyltransferase
MPWNELSTLKQVLVIALALGLAAVTGFVWYSGWERTHPIFKVIILGFTALFVGLAGWVALGRG